MSKATEWVQLPPRYLFAIALATGLLLFGPSDLIGPLGLTTFVEEWRPAIGVVFLTAGCLLTGHAVVGPVAFLWGYLHDSVVQTSIERRGRKRLENLTEDERRILKPFVERGTRSVRLDIMDGNVKSLVQAGILYQGARLGDLVVGFAFNLQPWAWNYLRERPELIQREQH